MDPCCGGVNDGDTCLHVSFKDPAVHDLLNLCKLDPVVDSACIVKVAYNCADCISVTDEDTDGICKVVFLLRVVCADPS